MRKIFYMLLILMGGNLYAQPKFAVGIKTGCSSYLFLGTKIDSVTVKNSTVYSGVNYHGKFNYNFGYLIFARLSNHLYLNTGLNWASKLVEVNWIDVHQYSWYDHKYISIGREKVSQVYLELPLEIFYFLSDESKFYFKTGMVSEFEISNGDILSTGKYSFKSPLFMVNGGAGYYIKYHRIYFLMTPEAGFFIHDIYKNHWEINNGRPLYFGMDFQMQFKTSEK